MKKIMILFISIILSAQVNNAANRLSPIEFNKPEIDNTPSRIQRILPTSEKSVFFKSKENIDIYLKRMFKLKSLSPSEERYFNLVFKNHSNALSYINSLTSITFFKESEKLSKYIKSQVNCNILKKDKIKDVRESLLVSVCLFPQYVQEYYKTFEILKNESNNFIVHDGDLSFLDVEVGNWQRQMFVNNNDEADTIIFKHLMLKSAIKSMLDDISVYFESYLSKGRVSAYLYTLPRLRAALRYENKLLSLYEYYNQIICKSNTDKSCSTYKQLIASTLEWELSKQYEMIEDIDHMFSNLKTLSNDKATVQKFKKISMVSKLFFELHHGNVYAPCFIALISKRYEDDEASPNNCIKIDSFKAKYFELTSSPGFLKQDLVNAYNSMYIFENLRITYSLLKNSFFYSGRMQVSSESELLLDKNYLNYTSHVLNEIEEIKKYLNIVTNKEYAR